MRLHPAQEQPRCSSPQPRSPRGRGVPDLPGRWRTPSRGAGERAAQLLPLRARALGAAPEPTRVPQPVPRSAAPAAFPAGVPGGAAAGQEKWRAPLASLAAARFPREAAGVALHSLTASGHAIGGFAVPGHRGSRWRARFPSRGERQPPVGAGWPRLLTRVLSPRDLLPER